ncbi:cysteate racemase [Calidifontibacter terrae]
MSHPDMSSADSTFSVRDDAAWASPTVGVIGGNGPAATALFQDVLVQLTPAHRDQDHLDLVVLVHSSQPDRTAHILDASEPDPGPVLARDAARLDALGTDFTVIPCNTAYHFLDEIAAATTQPVLSIVKETAKAAVSATAGGTGRIGVLATDGTRAAGVYERVITELGATPVFPGEADQALTMSVIYDGVKAGGEIDLAGLEGVIERLLGVSDVVVLGCTELSVIYAQQHWQDRPRIVDSIASLAAATLRAAGR